MQLWPSMLPLTFIRCNVKWFIWAELLWLINIYRFNVLWPLDWIFNTSYADILARRSVKMVWVYARFGSLKIWIRWSYGGPFLTCAPSRGGLMQLWPCTPYVYCRLYYFYPAPPFSVSILLFLQELDWCIYSICVLESNVSTLVPCLLFFFF